MGCISTKGTGIVIDQKTSKTLPRACLFSWVEWLWAIGVVFHTELLHLSLSSAAINPQAAHILIPKHSSITFPLFKDRLNCLGFPGDFWCIYCCDCCFASGESYCTISRLDTVGFKHFSLFSEFRSRHDRAEAIRQVLWLPLHSLHLEGE